MCMLFITEAITVLVSPSLSALVLCQVHVNPRQALGYNVGAKTYIQQASRELSMPHNLSRTHPTCICDCLSLPPPS